MVEGDFDMTLESAIDALEALPVHSISGYDWECYEPDTGCHWHNAADRGTTCAHGHLITDDEQVDRDGIPCSHRSLLDRDRAINALLAVLGHEPRPAR